MAAGPAFRLAPSDASGSGAINTEHEAGANAMQVTGVFVTWDNAPGTSENYTITLMRAGGGEILLYSEDPSASSATVIAWWPPGELWLSEGDKLKVAFPGTDNEPYTLLVQSKGYLEN